MSKYPPGRPGLRVGWPLAVLFVLAVSTCVGLLTKAVLRARMAAQSMVSM